MDNLDFTRSRALNNIPSKKLQEVLSVIECGNDSFDVKAVKLTAINRYAESNIPIGYWSLKMERDFQGDPRLKQKYTEYVSDLKSSYLDGSSICFAAKHGLGKTLTMTCILKSACNKGYSCLYTDLSNVVSVLTQASNEEKFLARKELSMIDFLAIDEVDPRFIGQSDQSNDLFAKSFEYILRTRLQGKLPTLLATNSPNIKEVFTSSFKESLGSLMNKITIFYATGDDFRKNK